jgi:ATP-dependent RNA helicase DOB1
MRVTVTSNQCAVDLSVCRSVGLDTDAPLSVVYAPVLCLPARACPARLPALPACLRAVHYMRDRERGVVWEESIILLPPTINMVFLSATLTNHDTQQFADWVCRLKTRPCHVVSTSRRPVPLCHYLFPTGAEGLFLAVDEKGHFMADNIATARNALLIAKDKRKFGPNRNDRVGGGGGDGNDLVRLVQLMTNQNWLPIIVFSFARRECEARALQVSKLDLTTGPEKEAIVHVFTQAMASLAEEDRNLTQIETILPLLRRGIGVHHSGLLPIVKETVEILFGEGLLKILFATETFAMGVNMPAR